MWTPPARASCLSSLGNKHKHKIIFVLLVILCVAVNIHFTPLSLPAEDFVTVGYTTTLFSQTHSFKDLVLNYHYPHGSVLVLSLLYYPFYHTGLWFTVHAYLPLLVHLGLFLVFHSFCFNHARRYYVLLDLWFIFPSFMFITFLQ